MDLGIAKMGYVLFVENLQILGKRKVVPKRHHNITYTEVISFITIWSNVSVHGTIYFFSENIIYNILYLVSFNTRILNIFLIKYSLKMFFF